MTTNTQNPDTRFRIILLILLLSPVLGWNGIIVALIIAFRHLRKLRIGASPTEGKASFWFISLAFFGYYITCVLSDLFHPNHLGHWNQFKILIPLITTLLYLTHQNKIAISYEILVSTTRHAVVIIALLTGAEYLYFTEIRNLPEHRSALLAGNPLHVSHWVPTLTLISLGPPKVNDKRELFNSMLMLAFSSVTLIYALEARSSLLILLTLGIPFVILQAFYWNYFQAIRHKHSNHLRWTITSLAILFMMYWLVGNQAPERIRWIFTSGFNIEEIARKDSSLHTRLEYWKAGSYAVKINPFYGYGKGNENNALKNHVPSHVEHHRHAHQQFISFGIAGGLSAIFFGFLFIISPVIFGLMNKKYKLSYINLPIFLTMPVMLNAMTDSLLNNARHVAIFFLFFALIFSVKRNTDTSLKNYSTSPPSQ